MQLYLLLVLQNWLSRRHQGMQMDMVPHHPPCSWHPGEAQRAVAVLTDMQILGTSDLLSCKKREERPLVWTVMVTSVVHTQAGHGWSQHVQRRESLGYR